MGTVGLLGASGYTGRLVASRLADLDVSVVAAGRDPSKLRRVLDDRVADLRRADIGEPVTLEDLAGSVDVLITTVGPFSDLGQPVLEAAIASGTHYLDSAGEQSFVRWAYTRHEHAAATGATYVPACGFDFVPGDLLADVAARELTDVDEVHVAYLVRGRGLFGSRGTRRSIARVLTAPAVVLRDGELVPDRLGERRRLAWFPKPVGPHHAAGMPGGEPLMVPRHVEGVRTVGTYIALPSALAELGQMAASVARWEPAGELLERVMAMGPEGPSGPARRAVRWACVAEARSRAGDVARAWANGNDIYAFTADVLALAAAELAAGRGRAAGVVAPAQAFDPQRTLDDLAVATGLRWSVR